MLRIALCIVVAIATISTATAASDGEIGWSRLSFCDGAGNCVDISTAPNHDLASVKITYKGNPVESPRSLGEGLGDPWLQDVRLISISLANGNFANRLEIPFYSHASKESVLLIWFSPDRVYKTQVVSAPRKKI